MRPSAQEFAAWLAQVVCKSMSDVIPGKTACLQATDDLDVWCGRGVGGASNGIDRCLDRHSPADGGVSSGGGGVGFRAVLDDLAVKIATGNRVGQDDGGPFCPHKHAHAEFGANAGTGAVFYGVARAFLDESGRPPRGIHAGEDGKRSLGVVAVDGREGRKHGFPGVRQHVAVPDNVGEPSGPDLLDGRHHGMVGDPPRGHAHVVDDVERRVRATPPLGDHEKGVGG